MTDDCRISISNARLEERLAAARKDGMQWQPIETAPWVSTFFSGG